MNNHKKILNMFESWGKGKQEVPPNNDVLKREILSKVSVNFSERVSHRRSPFIWLPFAFTTMAIIVVFINTTSYKNGGVSRQNIIQNESEIGFSPISGAYKSDISIAPQDNYGELPISDNREFLKIDYNATLRTRHVVDLKNKVEMIVRGLDGRVDASSSGERSGYVSFAIPKDRLEAFKIEIKSLVGTRFYNEYISSQNFLPTKQMIEKNQKQIENNLSDLQVQRGQIVKNHNQSISSYQSRINSINIEINTLNTEYQSATIIRRAEIVNRINLLQVESGTLQLEITNENKNFQVKISGIDVQIKNTQKNLKVIKLQDSNLINNVATVNGTISLNWISLWNIADAYLLGPILAWVFFLAALVSFIWYRYSIRVSYLDF